jgi:DNA-binding transcriptional LysR family regulator
VLALDDLTTLSLFVEVVELRSFTAAARAAGMAKATVSRRIAELEQKVGTRLLRRTTRQVTLTEEGKVLFERSVRVVAAAKEASEVLVDANGGRPAGILRVASPVVFAHRHLTAAVVDFLGRYPDVQLQLLPASAPVDLVADEIDVAIRGGKASDSSFVARRLFTDQIVAVASDAYLRRHGKPRTLADLAGHVSLRLSPEAAHPRWRFRGPPETSSLGLRRNLVASDAAVVREAAILGLGLAWLPSHCVADDVRAGLLTRVLESADLPKLPIRVVYPERRKLPLRVRSFVDFVVERFSSREWRAKALLVEG